MRNTAILLAISTLFFISCKKSPFGPGSGGTTDLPPAITPVGTAVDNGITQSIGSGGGTLTSVDGRLTVTIPAGALATTTTIGIQAVTNTAPGGLGNSYLLTPAGQTFSTPATFTFHYTADDASGTLPELFYVAYQDSIGEWLSDSRHRTVDTLGHTVSLAAHHFTIWTLGAQLKMTASPDLLNESETSTINVFFQKESSKRVPDPAGGDDLATLEPQQQLADNAVSDWKVNGAAGGDPQDGVISGSGSSVNYTSPAAIDKERTVQVSADLNYQVSEYNNGILVASLDKLILFTPITLEPSVLKFEIDAVTTLNGTSEVYADVYTDEVKFEVDLDHGNVTVPTDKIVNFPPKVANPTGTDGTSTATWVPDQIGVTNMTDALDAFFTTDDSITIVLDHSGTVGPTWQIKDQNGTYQNGGDAVPGLPPSLYFSKRDTAIAYFALSNDYAWTVLRLH